MNIWYGKETLNIIDGLCKEGMDIPLAVKVVVKVKKIYDYKSMKGAFDFEKYLVNSNELVGSLILLEGDHVVGILISQGIRWNLLWSYLNEL